MAAAAAASRTLRDDLGQALDDGGDDSSSNLKKVLLAVADAVAHIAGALRGAAVDKAGSVNAFGDEQLAIDILADKTVFEKLRQCGAVSAAASEETPHVTRFDTAAPTQGYSVAFDPLDGSSVVDANFAVGSIFGIWPGDGFINRTGAEQSAAAYAIYGPRTVLVVAFAGKVHEYVLTDNNEKFMLVRKNMRVAMEGKTFAPANLRAAADNQAYRDLVHRWMDEKLTLRYTGAMVPDIHHILTKGHGVFCNPASPSAKPKIRLLYEAAPLAYIIETAGGVTSAGNGGSILDLNVSDLEVRTPVCLGSEQLVRQAEDAMRASGG